MPARGPAKGFGKWDRDSETEFGPGSLNGWDVAVKWGFGAWRAEDVYRDTRSKSLFCQLRGFGDAVAFCGANIVGPLVFAPGEEYPEPCCEVAHVHPGATRSAIPFDHDGFVTQGG